MREMKKIVLVFIGMGAAAGLVLLVSRNRTGDESSGRTLDTASVEDNHQAAGHQETKASAQSEALSVATTGMAEPPAPESDAVLTLIHPDSDYQTRLDAMRGLGYEMAPQDVAALMEFLHAPMSADEKLRPRAFNSIRNDALEILLRQKQMPEGMGELLTAVYADPSHDDMWRNYCIQFMEPYYEQLAKDAGPSSGDDMPRGGTRPAEDLQAIQDTLWSALGERDNSNAGTALLAMDKLSRNHPEFDREQISAAMIDLATDKQAPLANRVTALRLCGEQGHVQALETARDLAQNSDTTMLRCAAIATLGDLGTEEDLVLLEACAASSDRRIQRMARRSLEKLASAR
jgi:hypothetical protein